MKKITSFLCAAACMAAYAVPFTANAADSDKVYGTMNIPYADFYAAELNNSVPVDAVSSATTNKWKGNNTGSMGDDGKWQSGGLAAGTFNTETENGGGKILGVTYPVEISKEDLEKLSDKMGFTELSEKPKAYKPVTVESGKASFGKLVDTDGEEALSGEMTVTSLSSWGDYQINVKGIPANCDIYGVIVKTKEGTDYGMRALENIWRNGAISWGAGVKEKEPHGNVLSSEHYKSSQGQTITDVTFITLNGYSTLSGQNGYLPLKFADSLTVESGKSGKGTVTFDNSSFPADYKMKGTVADGFTVSGNTVSYNNAQPGNYTLTVSDEGGKYSDVRGSFTLTTDAIPVKYSDGKLVAADGASLTDAANYLKNISAVTVGEKRYAAGRRGATIIDSQTGEIKLDAKSGEENVFDGSGKYKLTVESTGYEKNYEFEINDQAAETTTAATTSKTTSTPKTTTAAAAKTTSSSNSPKTGTDGIALPAAFLALAGVSAFALRKKKD
ncbi:hemoblobin-interacting domain-containing protein [uncultured Ruminococcus sp.]|uniref:hemoblobin-interacting domain-containing protein n=1 Tax=uncultured Ruminococcus sp. TaxID=165186 RepID=UPI0025D51B85|nr:hemoblobin-interacting domain-containing protein [uncultured Ruminococcus sp.]